jgi:hypothetical protein
VILDCLQTGEHVDALLPLVYKWEQSENEAHNAREITRLFNSHQVSLVVGDALDDGEKSRD